MSIDYCHKHHEYRDTDFVVECPRCEEEKDQPSINKINNKNGSNRKSSKKASSRSRNK